MGAHRCCSIAMWQLPHSSLQKYVTLEFFSSLSNYTKYLILKNSCLAMKHDNSYLLPFPNSSRTFKYTLLFSTLMMILAMRRTLSVPHFIHFLAILSVFTTVIISYIFQLVHTVVYESN